MERKSYLGRILLAFVIATIIFLDVIFITYGISYSKSRSVAITQEEIYYNLLSSELEKEITSSDCTNFSPLQYSEELGVMGNLIGLLEEKFGKRDEKVLKQKEIYSMIELQHYFLVKDYNLQCGNNFPTILFFYSNEDAFIDSSEKTGFILSSLKKEKRNVMIYSFDYDLDFDIINLLKQKYNVDERNTIVLNDNLKLTNIGNINELEGYLD